MMFIIFFFSLFICAPLAAMDHIRYEKGQSALDARGQYKESVLRLALEHTVDSYGPYKNTTDAPIMNALQARKQLQTGKILNVFIAVTNKDWEKETIAIKYPVRKGLINYRLLLIHKDDLPLFANIKTIDELKQLTAGLLFGWSITSMLGEQGFNIIKANNYDGIFRMLDVHRFNYLPRGVNEIFSELEQRDNDINNVVIEPNLALYIPTPSYIFVSPKYPRLAKRLQEGFELMLEDGSFEALFQAHFAENIRKSNLHNRNILIISPTNIPIDTPFERDELWFTP